MNKEKGTRTDESNEEINATTDKSEYTFDPGQDWKLAWSDEFEGDSIDENNWSYQVLEAGHFNDEWQRYTNSPKNATDDPLHYYQHFKWLSCDQSDPRK